ncbi:MAG TPA: extracellular solute-binding protein [Deinococcales bacterium]|nr:extracellular solute-binding protein [Deinococcales bacterium]
MKLRAVVGLTALLALTGLSAAQNKKTITISVFPDLDTVVAKALPEFYKKFPNIEVKIVSLAYGDHHNALLNACATGSGASDVTAIDFGFVAAISQGQCMVDLSKAPYNANQYKQQFVNYTFPQATTDDGRLIAMPTDIGPGTMFYRPSILNKAGVKEADLQKSWESFIAAGKKIKAGQPNVFLLPDARAVHQIIIRSNVPAGEGLYFNAKGEPTVDSARFVKAFTMAKAVRDAKLDARIGEWSNEWYEAFKKGTVAVQFSGAWLMGHLQNWMAPDTKGDWRAANLPEGAYASWGGSFYGITNQSKNKAEAWELVKYLTADRKQQVNAFAVTGAFPALKAAQTDPMFQQGLPFLGGQKARILWTGVANRIQPLAVTRFDSQAEEVVNAELGRVLDEGKDIKQALADAKTEITRRARR